MVHRLCPQSSRKIRHHIVQLHPLGLVLLYKERHKLLLYSRIKSHRPGAPSELASLTLFAPLLPQDKIQITTCPAPLASCSTKFTHPPHPPAAAFLQERGEIAILFVEKSSNLLTTISGFGEISLCLITGRASFLSMRLLG